jgi:formylmethanofuran dehydrogenase subunit C
MKLWLAVPVLAASIAATGCDIVTAELRAEETAQWHKTYQLDPKGRVEISNVNGKIEVVPSTGNTVDVEATKKARGASSEAAKAALDRVTIAEDIAGGRIRVETKVARTSGFSFMNGGVQVEYRVKVPAGAEVKFATVNGGVDVTGLEGRIVAETTNGGVTTHGVSGQLDASTTNGGLDIDLLRMPEGGVKLECTNGGIKVRLPKDAKASVSASISNGGISTENLLFDATGENNRRRLEGRLNGGGPRLDIEGVNGGIRLLAR